MWKKLRQMVANWLMLAGLILCAAAMTIGGCSQTTSKAPPPPVVKVPVSQPCAAETPTQRDLPKARQSDGIFDLAKTVAAQRRILRAENTELRAALEGCKQ